MATTRSKRKLEGAIGEEGIPTNKVRCFSNLTNHVELLRSRTETIEETQTDFATQSQPSSSNLAQKSDGLTQNSSAEPAGDGVRLMISMRKVLELNFKNVCERLRLQSIPPCLYDLKMCRKQHSKALPLQLASSEDEYTAKSFLQEDRHDQFIVYVRNCMCGQKKFPGIETIRGILELILKITSDGAQKTNVPTKQTLTDLYSLFISVLSTFPTCHAPSYLQLFRSPFKLKGYKGSKQGMFLELLDIVSVLIHSDEPAKAKVSGKNEQFNFYAWEAQNEEASSFVNFSCDEKFRRIFLIFDLLTRVLENDLAMFILKYSGRLSSSLRDGNQRPLICSVLWQKHESVVIINSTIKLIIDIYVNMIALAYPTEEIRVVSRLISLVGQLLNLHEYPDQTVEYPFYKNITMDLVRSIQQTTEKSAHYSIELFTSVVENLRSPLIQMLLTNLMLQKIHNRVHAVSLQIPYESLRDQRFDDFNDEPAKAIPQSFVKHPVVDRKKKAKLFKIHRRAYLKLLRIHCEAIDGYYRIQAGFAEFTKQAGEKVEKVEMTEGKSLPFDFRNFEQKLKEVDLEEKIKLRQVDLSFVKQVHMKFSNDCCQFYRNEMKHFMLLKKLLKKLHENRDGKFDDWMELFKADV